MSKNFIVFPETIDDLTPGFCYRLCFYYPAYAYAKRWIARQEYDELKSIACLTVIEKWEKTDRKGIAAVRRLSGYIAHALRREERQQSRFGQPCSDANFSDIVAPTPRHAVHEDPLNIYLGEHEDFLLRCGYSKLNELAEAEDIHYKSVGRRRDRIIKQLREQHNPMSQV